MPLSFTITDRTVILAVGNEINGDDGIGPALANAINGKTPAVVINAGVVPENFASKIISLNPELLLIIDCAKMGKTPGEICVIEEKEISNVSFSTHNASIAVLCKYLRASLEKLNIKIIGIEPERTDFGAQMSPSAETALKNIVKIFTPDRVL